MNALTAAEWTKRLAELYANERNATVELLLALSEFDERRLWQALGYNGLFNYLHIELGMSKATAYYRKTGAELVRRFPALVEPMRDGRLCMSSLVELSKVIDDSNWKDVLPRFFGCSRREAQKVAVAIAPVQAPPRRDVITPLPVNRAQAEISVQPAEPTRMTPARTLEPRPSEARPLTPSLHRVHFTASTRFIEKLEKAKDELARQFPDGDLEAIFEAGLDLLLAQAAKRRAQVQKPRAPTAPIPESPTRHIPAAVKREVWTRDDSKCQWPLASGGICGERRYLEVDHVLPRALGGPSTTENARILCRAHNQQAARERFGDDWMSQFGRFDSGRAAHAPPEHSAGGGNPLGTWA